MWNKAITWHLLYLGCAAVLAAGWWQHERHYRLEINQLEAINQQVLVGQEITAGHTSHWLMKNAQDYFDRHTWYEAFENWESSRNWAIQCNTWGTSQGLKSVDFFRAWQAYLSNRHLKPSDDQPRHWMHLLLWHNTEQERRLLLLQSKIQCYQLTNTALEQVYNEYIKDQYDESPLALLPLLELDTVSRAGQSCSLRFSAVPFVTANFQPPLTSGVKNALRGMWINGRWYAAHNGLVHFEQIVPHLGIPPLEVTAEIVKDSWTGEAVTLSQTFLIPHRLHPGTNAFEQHVIQRHANTQ